MFIVLRRHQLHNRGVSGESHVRSCQIPLFVGLCLLSRHLCMRMITCSRVYIRTQAWGENVSQSGLTLLECSLFCSSGSLGLVLHSHQCLLASQTFHLWAATGSALIVPHPRHSPALITAPPSSCPTFITAPRSTAPPSSPLHPWSPCLGQHSLFREDLSQAKVRQSLFCFLSSGDLLMGHV